MTYDFLWVGKAAEKSLRYATAKPFILEKPYGIKITPIIEVEVTMEDDNDLNALIPHED